MADPPGNPSFTESLCATTAAWQVRCPWRFVAVGALLAIAALPFVAGVGVTGGPDALFPDSTPSRRAAAAYRERFGFASTLTVALSGDEIVPVRELTAAVGSSLERNPPAGMRAVDWNVAPLQRFVAANKALYIGYNDFVIVRDLIAEQIEYHAASANPLAVNVADPPPDPMETLHDLRRRSDRYTDLLDSYPDGYFQHPTRPLTLLFLHTDIPGTEPTRAAALVAEVQRRIDELRPAVVGGDGTAVRNDFGGDLFAALLDAGALRRRAPMAMTAVLLLALLAVYVLFASGRAAGIIGLSLAGPVLISLGLAGLLADCLNPLTAFVACVIVGLGIHPGVMWLAHYRELRRRGNGQLDAIRVSHRDTASTTLLTSAAMAMTCASLGGVGISGLRDFGIVAAVGVALSWLAACGLLPALVVLFARGRPLWQADRRTPGDRCGAVLGRMVLCSPRLLALATAAATGAAMAMATLWVLSEPMAYDRREPDADVAHNEAAERVNAWQRQIAPFAGGEGVIAMLVPTAAHAVSVRDQLDRRRTDFGSAYGDVYTLDLLRPERQEAKLSLLRDIRRQVLKLRRHMNAEQWQELVANLPPEDLSPLDYSDLPAMALRWFTETDGQRGRVVYVRAPDGADAFDGRTLLRWAAAVRSVTLPDGTEPWVAGAAPLFADVHRGTITDGTRTMVVAAAVIALLLSFAFARWRERLLCAAGLLVGSLWAVALLAWCGTQINAINCVAVALVLGAGSQGLVVVLRRAIAQAGDRDEPSSAVQRALREVGGPVVLCALTAAIGYGALWVGSGGTASSLGCAVMVGAATCLAAATLAVPAGIVLEEHRAAR